MTCVAFSIKFARTNQKFAENSEFCEKNSLLLWIIHFAPLRKELCKTQDKNRQRVMAETGLSADGSPVVDIVEDLAVEEAAPQFAAQPSLPVISF